MNPILPALCIGAFTFCIVNPASAHAIEEPVSTTPGGATTVEDNIDRGSLGYELLGGSIGLLVGAGVTYAAVASQGTCGPGGHGAPSPCAMESLAAMMTHIFLTTPLLITGGVILGGNATGSNGRFFSTWGGATLGLLAGFLVTAPLANEDASYEARLATIPLVGLTAVGGAVLFYRNSASAPRISAAPTLDGRGAMFTISGAM